MEERLGYGSATGKDSRKDWVRRTYREERGAFCGRRVEARERGGEGAEVGRTKGPREARCGGEGLSEGSHGW